MNKIWRIIIILWFIWIVAFFIETYNDMNNLHKQINDMNNSLEVKNEIIIEQYDLIDSL